MKESHIDAGNNQSFAMKGKDFTEDLTLMKNDKEIRSQGTRHVSGLETSQDSHIDARGGEDEDLGEDNEKEAENNEEKIN